MSGEPSREVDPIKALHDRYLEASRTGDVETLTSLFAEDAVLMPPNDTSFYGRSEIKEWFEEYFEHFRIDVLTETERDVNFIQGWAVERWSYTIAITPQKGGERIRDDGRFLVVWRLDPDGVWRMSQVMFNSTRPIGSGTSRFLSRMMDRRKEP